MGPTLKKFCIRLLKKYALNYSYVHKSSSNRKLPFLPEGVLRNIDFQVGYMCQSVKRMHEVHKIEEYS